MMHSTLALFAQRTRIPTSARSIGFCVIWVCISLSSSSGSGDDYDNHEECIRESLAFSCSLQQTGHVYTLGPFRASSDP